MFSCEFCETFKNTFSTEYLWTTASKTRRRSWVIFTYCPITLENLIQMKLFLFFSASYWYWMLSKILYVLVKFARKRCEIILMGCFSLNLYSSHKFYLFTTGGIPFSWKRKWQGNLTDTDTCLSRFMKFTSVGRTLFQKPCKHTWIWLANYC